MKKRLINFFLPPFSELDVILLLVAIIVTCGFYFQEVSTLILGFIHSWKDDDVRLVVVISLYVFFFLKILSKMILTTHELTLDEKRGAATTYYCLLGAIGICASYISIAGKTEFAISDAFVFYMLFRSMGSLALIRVSNRRNYNLPALQMNNMQLHLVPVAIGLICVILANIYYTEPFFITLVVAYSYASIGTSLLGGVIKSPPAKWS
jgi:hypothetical protein